MENLDNWRLADELTVTDTAMLILGCQPSTSVVPEQYGPTLKALQNAIRSGRLPARIRHPVRSRGYDEEPDEGEGYPVLLRTWSNDWVEEHIAFGQGFMGETTTSRSHILRIEPDWERTTISVQDVQSWLSTRGVNTGFFFPAAPAPNMVPAYLNPNHPRYSPKLAATVMAWQAVQEPKGRSPKQTLEDWLEKHAAEFSLSANGVTECAKVANWSRGGAPTTPTA